MDIVRSRPTSRITKRALIAFALGIVVIVLAVSWRRTSSAAVPSVERQSTWTERVKRGDLVRQVPVQGTLVPEHVQWLSATTAARVARIVVRPGAQVEPDTIVVVLENTDLELAAIEAERQAASAAARLIELDVKTTVDERQQATALATLRAELRDADRHAGDANRLGREGLMSENERRDAIERVTGINDRVTTEQARHGAIVSGRVRQLDAQRAEIERLREIAAFRKRQLAAMEVRAGARGIVQEVPLENGQWVAIGTLLAKVAEPGRLKAEVKVAETYARDVHKGLAVRFEGTGSGSTAFAGRVERVDPSVIAGSVRLEVTLDDGVERSGTTEAFSRGLGRSPNENATTQGARADQHVSGYVEIEKLENVLFVGRPAGATDGSSVGVFRLESDRAHASRVTVQLGRSSARDVEILGGLEAGDEIVVSDTSAWESSTRVRLQ